MYVLCIITIIRTFDASHLGKKGLKSYGDKKCKARIVVGGGCTRARLYDPGSVGSWRRRKGGTNIWDGNENNRVELLVSGIAARVTEK